MGGKSPIIDNNWFDNGGDNIFKPTMNIPLT